MEHQLSPYEVFAVSTVLRCSLGALLRGKLHVLWELLAMGRRTSMVEREWKSRKALLAEVDNQREPQIGVAFRKDV